MERGLWSSENCISEIFSLGPICCILRGYKHLHCAFIWYNAQGMCKHGIMLMNSDYNRITLTSWEVGGRTLVLLFFKGVGICAICSQNDVICNSNTYHHIDHHKQLCKVGQSRCGVVVVKLV